MYSRRDKSMRWISVNWVCFFVGFENSCHTQNRSWMFYIRITSRDHANGGKKYAASMLTKFLQSILKSILKVKSVPLSSITVLWVIKNCTRTVAQWLGKREVYNKPSSHKETPKILHGMKHKAFVIQWTAEYKNILEQKAHKHENHKQPKSRTPIVNSYRNACVLCTLQKFLADVESKITQYKYVLYLIWWILTNLKKGFDDR